MSPLRVETASCVMCGTADADVPVGGRWMCRPDAERMAWHLTEARGVAELCGLTVEALRRELTR